MDEELIGSVFDCVIKGLADVKICTGCKETRPLGEFPKDREKKDGFYSRCKVCVRVKNGKWYRENHDKELALRKRWRVENLGHVRKLNTAAKRRWKIRNPDKALLVSRVHAAKRRSQMAGRTWPGEFNKRWIEAIYEAAQGLDLVVDHIVPLNGKNVCGLHVPLNMQLLSASRNREKSNRYKAA